MKKKQTTKKRQTWTPAKRAAFAAKMKAARAAAEERSNYYDAKRNPPTLPFHVYAEDGFESAHKTEAAAKRAADQGARRRRMHYSVIRVSASGFTGGGQGTEVYATDEAKRTTKNPPSVNGEGMTFAEWRAAAGPQAPKGLDAVKAWKAGEDPTEYRAQAPAAKKNGPTLSRYHQPPGLAVIHSLYQLTLADNERSARDFERFAQADAGSLRIGRMPTLGRRAARFRWTVDGSVYQMVTVFEDEAMSEESFRAFHAAHPDTVVSR